MTPSPSPVPIARADRIAPPRTRVCVVGGGILGTAVARRLLQVHPDLDLTLLEKEDTLAAHQSGRNSGVIHAGIYYAPGSLKATLCRRGVALLHTFASEHGIAVEVCGKLIVAFDDEERARLRVLFDRARANGVPGVRMVDANGLRAIEPHAAGVEALHSPETAIIDYVAVTRALAGDVERAGGRVLTGQPVVGIAQHHDRVIVQTHTTTREFDAAVICAGLHTDRLARLAGDGDDPQIVPFRGEYYLLRPDRRSLVRGLIYPVPDPRYPFLGVHLTRRYDGEVLVGPNAVLALSREGYRRDDVNLADLWEIARWPGFRRMARAHWRRGLDELRGSLSRRAFVALARRYVPELTEADVIDGPAGIRAQAIARDGSLVDDFRISQLGRIAAIRNAPSPGATSSLAIAEYIVDRLTIVA